MADRSPRVAIVGAGMSGLCVAARLRAAGLDRFTVYEKADAVGGTWRENTYPGLACDVPSRFYQFSFAPNPDWTHLFSPGAEIRRYFEQVADRLDLRQHIRFGAAVVSATWQDGRWTVMTDTGESEHYDFLVTACGVLHHPRVPDLPGAETFTGAAFHSARWDHDVPVEDRRVAVIGTGSTGAQIVCGLSGRAAQVDLYQRSAQWILPLPNPRSTGVTRAARRRLPALDALSYRVHRAAFEWTARALTDDGLRRRAVVLACRLNLRTVRDPALRAALTPDYVPMCRRLVISAGFYPAIQRPGTALITAPIRRLEPGGIRTEDGVLHPADVIVYATGFDAHAYMRPLAITGRGGITLSEAWKGGPRAYRTVAMPGFPNLFTMMGPHSPVGNYSLVAIAETQAAHAIAWISAWQRRELDTVEPTEGATARFNADLREALPGTVWTTGCDSWYLGEDGLPELWPWVPGHHRALLTDRPADDYAITKVTVDAAP